PACDVATLDHRCRDGREPPADPVPRVGQLEPGVSVAAGSAAGGACGAGGRGDRQKRRGEAGEKSACERRESTRQSHQVLPCDPGAPGAEPPTTTSSASLEPAPIPRPRSLERHHTFGAPWPAVCAVSRRL